MADSAEAQAGSLGLAARLMSFSDTTNFCARQWRFAVQAGMEALGQPPWRPEARLSGIRSMVGRHPYSTRDFEPWGQQSKVSLEEH